MQRRCVFAVWAFAAIWAVAGLAAAETVRLEDLYLGGMSSGWGKPQRNQSVTERPLSIGGRKFERGVGTHANSESWITLDGKTKYRSPPRSAWTTTPTGMWRERDYLERTGFMGDILHFETWKILVELMCAIQQGGFQAIRSATGPDLIAFHCWQCDAEYCQTCWRIGPPKFDEDFPGFYDCTRGVCPAGHTQVVDD